MTKSKFVRAALGAARTPLPNAAAEKPYEIPTFRVNFSVSAKGNNGRLKRRPYGFCFYYTPLWLNSSCFLHPSALLVKCTPCQVQF